MQYTTQSAPLPYVEPYLQNFLQRANDVSNAQYTASPQTYVDPNQTLAASWSAAANRAWGGSPVMGAANTQAKNLINGGFMGSATMNPYLSQANPNAGAMNQFAGMSNQFMPLDNPYLRQSVQQQQQDAIKNYNLTAKPAWDTAMQRSGSFGNTGIAEMAAAGQDDLQRNLARIGTDAYNNAYNQSGQYAQQQIQNLFGAGQQQAQNLFNAGQQQAQNMYGAGAQYAGSQDAMTQQARALQLQAIGMAPTLANQDYTDIAQLNAAGQQQQEFAKQRAAQNYQWWNEAQQYPMQRLGFMGQALGMGGQGQTTTQNTPDPSTASQMMGGGLTMAAIYNLLFPK